MMVKKGVSVALALLLMWTSLAPAMANENADERAVESKMEKNWQLVWEDEFEGSTLDDSKWSYDQGNGFVQEDGNYVPGWGNEELQYYSEDNVKVKDGMLTIEGKKETVSDDRGTYDYTSGKIHTKGKFHQKYGKFEAKIKLPSGQGFWPAFWMMPEEDKYGGWAASGEIDIMEAAGGTPDKMGGAIHYGGQWPNNTYTAKDYYFAEGEDITDFHVYSVEWEPGEIRWYVDGELFQTLNNWSSIGTGNATKYSYPAPFDQEFYLILNLAIGGWYGGGPNDSTAFPGEMLVDYVKVYKMDDSEYREAIEPVFEPEELPSGSKEAIDGNYIYDTDYERGFTTVKAQTDQLNDTYWNFVHLDQFGGNGAVSVDTVNEKRFAKVDISQAGGQPHSVQLIQQLPVGKGRTYKVSFDAKASGNRNVNMKVSGGEERGWSLYSANYEVPLTDEVQSYAYTFQMQAESDSKARLEFNLGLNGQTVWIGNVKVEEVDAIDPYNEDAAKQPLRNGNHIYNGTFDQGRMDRMTYWNFIINGADAQAYVTEEQRALAVDINDGGDIAALQLVQKGIKLEKNSEYLLKFTASAAANRDVQVALVSKDGSVNYSGSQTVGLTTVSEEKTVALTMNDLEDLEGQLVFYLGGSNHDIRLDDVTLLQVSKPEAGALPLHEIFPLKNGNFADGLKSWNSHVQGIYDGPSKASFQVIDGKAEISIDHEGNNPWDVIFMQENLPLKSGYRYTVSFDAKSSESREMEVVMEDSQYNRFLSEKVQLTSEFERYTFEFDMENSETAGLKYLLGKIDGADIIGKSHHVTIDNVLVEIKEEREKLFPLKNGDFGLELEHWNSHVQGVYDGPSSATVTEKEEEAVIKIDNVGNNPWDISFFQENLELTKGRTYLLEFDAKSTVGRKMEIVIDNGAPSYTRYFERILEISPTTETFTFEFEAGTDDITGLKFLLGKVDNIDVPTAHEIFIDNVKLEVKDARSYIEMEEQPEGTNPENPEETEEPENEEENPVITDPDKENPENTEDEDQDKDKDKQEEEASTPEKEKQKGKNTLPITATSIYTYLLFGVILLSLGMALFFVQRRRTS